MPASNEHKFKKPFQIPSPTREITVVITRVTSHVIRATFADIQLTHPTHNALYTYGSGQWTGESFRQHGVCLGLSSSLKCVHPVVFKHGFGSWHRWLSAGITDAAIQNMAKLVIIDVKIHSSWWYKIQKLTPHNWQSVHHCWRRRRISR